MGYCRILCAFLAFLTHIETDTLHWNISGLRIAKHKEKSLIPSMTIMLLMSGAGYGTAYLDHYKKLFLLESGKQQQQQADC